MTPSAYLLIAAAADFVAVIAHGVLGHRVMLSPLRPESLFPTWAFGTERTSWRIYAVSWHLVTIAFASSAIALLMLGLGRLQGTSLPQFIAAMHAGFFIVAMVILRPRVSALAKPVPIIFVVCMLTVITGSWLGAR